MPRNFRSSTLMKPLVVLALPGMYLFYKYNQYKQQQQEQNKRKVTERELDHLNQKIDKLLTTLEKNDSDLPTSPDEECVICCNAKASMQTYPCGHRVVCRKCFVKTIQSAVSQRLLPLRCVICRSKILRLKQNCSSSERLRSGLSERMRTSKSWSAFSTSYASSVPSSASQYSMSGSHKLNVPSSHSLYSVTSGTSLFSGVSSVSSATTSSFGTTCSGFSSRTSGSSIVRSKSLQYPRQPTGSFRRSQVSAMKNRLQEFREPIKEMEEKYEKTSKLTPIQEFQREFRVGRDISNSTRIRCTQKIITQLQVNPATQKPEITTRLSRFNTPVVDPQKCPAKRPEARSQTLSCRREKENVQTCSSSRKYSMSTSRKLHIDSKALDKIETADTGSSKTKATEHKKDKEKEIQSESKKVKKELSKAEKKQMKKQAKAEKKRLKEEAKRLAKEMKNKSRK